MPAAPARPSSGVTFTVLVSVVMGLCAVAMTLLLVMQGAPQAVAVGTLLAFLPVVPLVACFTWLDRYEPEPRGLLLLALGWGAFVATASALLLQVAGLYTVSGDEAASAYVVAPITEEAVKGLFVLLLLWFRRHELDGILDGIVYAGLVGVGFAFTENIIYLTAAYVGDGGRPGGVEGALTLFVVRGIFSPFAHPLFTSFIGIGIGVAVSTRSPVTRVLAPLLGYVVAVGAHALWNGSLVLGGGRAFLSTYLVLMVPAFLILVGFAIWARGREQQVLARALDDAARRGFFSPAEIPWVSRLGARRAARNHARAFGGRPAERAMRDYQQHAVELGFLHHRYLRGTAPRDFAARGRGHVDAMAALRPSLLWPPAAGRTGGAPPQPGTREGTP